MNRLNRTVRWILVGIFFALSAQAEVLSYGIVGDGGKWNKSTRSIRDSMDFFGVKRMVMPGDNLYGFLNRDYAAVWQQWAHMGFLFDVVAIGNHTAGYDRETQYFQMSGEYYSKKVENNARFIVLNSDNRNTVNAQRDFLESELKTATEPLVFLVYHHPTFTVSQSHRWEEKAEFQLAIRPLLVKYRNKIAALIIGHDHIATLAHFDDLPAIISGATHSFRENIPVNNVQDGVRVEASWYFDYSVYWARLDIDTEQKEARIHFIRGKDNQVSCSARVRTGSRAELEENCQEQGLQ